MIRHRKTNRFHCRNCGHPFASIYCNATTCSAYCTRQYTGLLKRGIKYVHPAAMRDVRILGD